MLATDANIVEDYKIQEVDPNVKCDTTLEVIKSVHVKRAFNFRRQCRAAVLSRCLHLARSHCRPLSLSISPL